MTPLAPLPLERGAGIAVWRQIAHRLESDLRAGELDAGARLPSEAELAARFTVNRHTVRRAIAELAARGLVRVEQGRGTFLQDLVIDYPLRSRTSFSANLLAQDRAPARDIREMVEVAADPEAARHLRLRRGARLMQCTSAGFADGVPVSYGRSWFPAGRFPGLADRLRQHSSISGALASYGLADYRRAATRILARLPSAEEAAHLKQPASEPVLVTEAVDVDPEGRPIRYGATCFAGARVQLTVAPEPS
ncbi:MAG TPA: phosphonate metabolism transcriptional regulator PhnF [Geminicoccaceae bacterium]|nr:phosphonate metabolism transcriptional regulator PhnF [Geminicoccaceae bacterium]